MSQPICSCGSSINSLMSAANSDVNHSPIRIAWFFLSATRLFRRPVCIPQHFFDFGNIHILSPCLSIYLQPKDKKDQKADSKSLFYNINLNTLNVHTRLDVDSVFLTCHQVLISVLFTVAQDLFNALYLASLVVRRTVHARHHFT